MPDQTDDADPNAEGPPLALPGGTVVTGEHHLPLAGVLVRWLTATDTSAPPVELGRAVTDVEGEFSVLAGTERASRAAQCAVRWDEDPVTVLAVGEQVRIQLDGSAPADADRLTVPLAHDGPSDDDWAVLAAHLAATGTLGTGPTVAHLLDPPADSPVALWEPGARATAVDRVASVLGSTLEELVDGPGLVDLTALGRGDLDAALTTYRDLDSLIEAGGFEVELGGHRLDELFPDLVGGHGSTERYRDYLRGVWVTAATAMHRWSQFGIKAAFQATEGQLIDQLERRFHQSFRTRDTTSKPAAELLIPILLEALTYPEEHGGWGLATSPARGTASDAEYLQVLIDATGEEPRELRNRFRVRFDRPESETVSAVDLNVEALLGLLSDTWQTPVEPFTVPLRGLEPYQPLLTWPHAGRAPFFLQCDEWLERQRPFFPENLYDVRRSLPEYHEHFRTTFEMLTTAGRAGFSGNGYFSSLADFQASAAWVLRLVAAVDGIREALALADQQNPRGARRRLESSRTELTALAKDHRAAWQRAEFTWWSGHAWNPPAERRISMEARARRRVRNEAELREVEAWFDQTTAYHGFQGQERGVARMRSLGSHHVAYLLTVAVPWLMAEILVALGDPAAALDELAPLTGFAVGHADLARPPGYATGSVAHHPYLYREGPLAYTMATHPDRRDPGRFLDADAAPGASRGLSYDQALPTFERRALRLAQGDIMLTLADQAFRRDEPASTRRARELCKGVILLHGYDPGTLPRWAGGGWSGPGNGLVASFLLRTNPAVDGQVARAGHTLMLIEAGLNVYGYGSDMVPVLRAAVHEGAARSFATSARAAQADLLAYTTRFEQAQIERWQATALVAKGEAGLTIAQERTEIAKAGVTKARQQVAAVEAQITAKKKEIEEANSIVGQFTGFLSGIKESMEGLVSSAQTLDGAAGAAGGAQSGGAAKAAAAKGIGGTAGAKDALVAKLGAGAGMTFAFGAFAYAGIMGIKSLGDAAAKRDGELRALREVALPAAKDGVRLAERDVTIGEAETRIARTELDLARTLVTFQQERFLSVALWNQLARFAQRTLRRYVELGARHAWLAERAVEYEQLRDVRIIKLDYVPAALRGVTGPDRLLLDLAELRSDRLLHERQRLPLKHTFSLARDFPLAFGELKATGRCRFHTDEDELRRTYPGLWGLRVVAVGVRTEGIRDGQARGVVRNLGVSTVSRADGGADVVVRYPDTMAVSELQLPEDALLHGVPGDTLLSFEGSGLTTAWELELPASGNPRGLGDLTDVLVTVDLRAHQSHEVQPPEASTPTHRSLLLAASAVDPVGLGSLHAATGPARITFDLRAAGLPRGETGRVVANLAIVTVGRTPDPVPISVRADLPAPTTVAVTLEDGVAMSRAGVLAGDGGVTPLTDLVGVPVDQVLVLEIAPADLTAEVRALHDVVLLVEYAVPAA